MSLGARNLLLRRVHCWFASFRADPILHLSSSLLLGVSHKAEAQRKTQSHHLERLLQTLSLPLGFPSGEQSLRANAAPLAQERDHDMLLGRQQRLRHSKAITALCGQRNNDRQANLSDKEVLMITVNKGHHYSCTSFGCWRGAAKVFRSTLLLASTSIGAPGLCRICLIA